MSQIQFQNVTPNDLQKLSYSLAKAIVDSGFIPTFMIALWRGGTPTAIHVHEFLKFKGIETDHIAIRTSAYEGTNQKKEIHVHGLNYIIEHANKDDKLLIVDDIFDTGRSVAKVLEVLKEKMRLNLPSSIKIATLFYKPKKTQVPLKPDYYCSETDSWVVFPHELEGLTLEQIRELKGDEIANMLK